ncbi:hypothetical protein VTO73DRAFT_14942 [Trametes versicolor]
MLRCRWRFAYTTLRDPQEQHSNPVLRTSSEKQSNLGDFPIAQHLPSVRNVYHTVERMLHSRLICRASNRERPHAGVHYRLRSLPKRDLSPAQTLRRGFPPAGRVIARAAAAATSARLRLQDSAVSPPLARRSAALFDVRDRQLASAHPITENRVSPAGLVSKPPRSSTRSRQVTPLCTKILAACRSAGRPARRAGWAKLVDAPTPAPRILEGQELVVRHARTSLLMCNGIAGLPHVAYRGVSGPARRRKAQVALERLPRGRSKHAYGVLAPGRIQPPHLGAIQAEKISSPSSNFTDAYGRVATPARRSRRRPLPASHSRLALRRRRGGLPNVDGGSLAPVRAPTARLAAIREENILVAFGHFIEMAAPADGMSSRAPTSRPNALRLWGRAPCTATSRQRVCPRQNAKTRLNAAPGRLQHATTGSLHQDAHARGVSLGIVPHRRRGRTRGLILRLCGGGGSGAGWQARRNRSGAISAVPGVALPSCGVAHEAALPADARNGDVRYAVVVLDVVRG